MLPDLALTDSTWQIGTWTGNFVCWVMVFFTGDFPLLLSPRKLQSMGKSRDGDFYAWLTHSQVFKAS